MPNFTPVIVFTNQKGASARRLPQTQSPTDFAAAASRS